MASTTAMLTGLSGLNANARQLDVIGNNIANVNTTAYKSNRMIFASQFSRDFSLGSTPSANDGGSNPAQVGLGVGVAGTQRNFNTGAINATGDSRDLAIEGEGFFIVQRASDQQFYTRAGAFRQNSTNDLVTVSGERVMGYGIDRDFNIIPGTLTPLNIPVGQLRLAEASTEVRFTGNLNARGTLPSRGSAISLPPLNDLSATPITGTTLLTGVDNPNVTGSQALFTAGQFIEIANTEKGGKRLPTTRLEITATTTVADLMTFIGNTLGVQSGGGVPNNPDGSAPGVTVDSTGAIQIVGNTGSINNLTLLGQNISVLSATGTRLGSPLTTQQTSVADGESVRTTFVAYDSLGNAVSLDLTMVLQSRNTNNGTTWRYYVDSPDNFGGPLQIGTGTVNFDAEGQLLDNVAPVTITLQRDNAGSVTPLPLRLSFNAPRATVSSIASSRSELAAVFTDGIPLGTLTSYSFGQDGVITGAFTNGLTRPIGQIALAQFSNADGLVDIGSNLFRTGPNSGIPLITNPTTLGTGRLIGGALEQSNVDLAAEFINLIQASTGYSAASRVITTTDQLIQQLLVLGR